MEVNMDILKGILHEYARGLILQDKAGMYWSRCFWSAITDRYNERANTCDDPVNASEIRAAGRAIQHEYCFLRATNRVDVVLDEIFKPCQPCHDNHMFIPDTELGIPNTRTTEFSALELDVLRKVLLAYRNNDLPNITRGDYMNRNFWNALSLAYNGLLPGGYSFRNANDMLCGARILQADFNKHRVMNNFNVNTGAMDTRKIFERCPPCKKRIIVFPLSLDSVSTSSRQTSSSRRTTPRDVSRRTTSGDVSYMSAIGNNPTRLVPVNDELIQVVNLIIEFNNTGHISNEVAATAIIHGIPVWMWKDRLIWGELLLDRAESVENKIYVITRAVETEIENHHIPPIQPSRWWQVTIDDATTGLRNIIKVLVHNKLLPDGAYPCVLGCLRRWTGTPYGFLGYALLSNAISMELQQLIVTEEYTILSRNSQN